MRIRRIFATVAVLSLLLCACVGGDMTQPTGETVQTQATTEQVTIATTEATTAPLHCAMYLPQYTDQQIMEYFEEIVFQVEYADGDGDWSLVQKWLYPVCYRIYGNPTEEDLAVLMDFFAQLNRLDGFPGIYAAEEGQIENLSISFMEPDELYETFYDFLWDEEAYGATQYWYYASTNEIHTAKIGYRTDIDQQTRNSILLEEVVNMLGVSDTVLREDSIVYQYSNTNLALSDVDWVILWLLYHPQIKSGMDAESCRAVIREIYY